MLSFAGRKIEELSLGYAVEVDPGSGSANLQIPVLPPPGRNNLTPPLMLGYASGGGNSAFGHGWNLSGLSAIGLDTSRHVAKWDGTDLYQIGGDELVPWLERKGAGWAPRGFERNDWSVAYLRSRRGSTRLRVEKWLHRPTGRIHFRARDIDNVLTVYGARPNAAARIADPADEHRTLLWLPELIVDPHGNAMSVEYAAETTDGIDLAASNEQRFPSLSQRYLKRVRYGNSAPLALDDNAIAGQLPAGLSWNFQVVLDYGDHDPATASATADRPWPARVDPFSTNRHGFEVRTWRLCRRFICFHEFAELGAGPTPVSALVLTHAPDPVGTTIVQVGRIGYRREPAGLVSKAIPPIQLNYTAPATEKAFTALSAVARENVPAGFAQRRVAFIDLLGEGLPGILTETDRAWLYKPNLGDGNFGSQALVLERPAVHGSAFGLGDMDGDGNTDMSQLAGRFAGLFMNDRESGQWTGFRPFENLPHVEGLGDRVRWVDLNGDGLADMVISHADRFTWYPSNGDTFGAAIDVPRPDGAEAVPTLKSDPALDFFFADMDGDGLVDLVRIKNGSIDYWPGRGQGQFGARVTMAGAPVFDDEGSFEQRRLRFVDLDGSGTTDIVYLGRGVVSCWINACGNRFVAGPQLAGLPYLDSISNVRILDFLGDGRACLVWSTPLPGREAPLQYLPLTPPVPPRLLIAIEDGLGRETRLTYASSARHYLRDIADGRGWKTRLPTHRMVVDRHEDIDRIGGGRSVRQYAYHDGYFDGGERVTRAFGQVDITDAEQFGGPGVPPETYAPPALTRLWFHLGTSMWDNHRPADTYVADAQLPWLGAHVVEGASDLAAEEIDDGLRALAGRLIRREVYALDTLGIPGAHPIAVQQERHRLRRLQPAFGDAPPAFFATRLDQAQWAYEQAPGDPRCSHQLVLTLDEHDQPTRQATIGYARRAAGRPRDVVAQDRPWLQVTDAQLLNIDEPDRYQLGLSVESRALELVGLRPAAVLFTREELTAANVVAAIAAPLSHDADPVDDPTAGPRARLLSWGRKLYWNQALSAALPLGQVGPVALVHHDDTACFSPAFIAATLAARVDDAALVALQYAQHDGLWWQSSEVHLFGGGALFDQRVGVRRADGAETRFIYDGHALLINAVTDTLGNVQTAVNDYHRLAPSKITDENGAVEEARYDALGVIVATSRAGHIGAQPWGFDALDAVASRTPANLAAALADPKSLIQGAATYMSYDLEAFGRDGSPPMVLALSRHDLLRDGAGGGVDGGIGVSVGYLDGFGRALQSKALSEPGPAIQRDGAGKVVVDAGGRPVLAPAATRWSVSGHTLFDGKQQPIRSYEPFFSATPTFEDDDVLRQLGSATLTTYDATGRMVSQHAANGTLLHVTIGAWQIEEADPNDTVMDSTWCAMREVLPASDPQRVALDQTKPHANTSKLTYLDPLGRSAADLMRGGTTAPDRRIETRRDIEGRVREVIDPRGLTAFRYRHDMMGRVLQQDSLDSGTAYHLGDGFGRDAVGWDARGFVVRHGFDLADRPTFVDVTGGDGAAPLDHRVEEYAYGESLADRNDAIARNLLGRPIRVRDGGGERRVDRYDPGGAVLGTSLQLRAQSVGEPDWRQAVALDPETIASSASFDAVGRATSDTLPDGSRRTYEYDSGGGLIRIRVTTPDGKLANTAILDGAEAGARGEITALTLGNGVNMSFAYEPDSLRLATQTAKRGAQVLQQLGYVYDPVGNIVRITDAAQDGPGALIGGITVPSQRDHVYDAHYRLRQATGRVHQALLQWDVLPEAPNTFKGTRRISFNDGAAVERYTRNYEFDAGGNLTQLRHTGATRNWTTNFWVSPTSNRALSALDPGGNALVNGEAKFDPAGNLRELPNLRQMEWDWSGSLARAVVVSRPGGTDDAERYVYTGGGQRLVRETTRVVGANIVEVTEKATFGDAERKRVRRNGVLVLERWTLHVGDASRRIALIHRWTRDDLAREVDNIADPRVRYQLSTPQLSAVMELDDAGKLISYEEYFPYGETAFVVGDDLREVARRDYRYSGKERDDFTGLYYYGHRYLVPWMGRWLSPDPLGPEDDLNLYQFVHGNPVTNIDLDGLDTLIPLDSISKKVTSPGEVMRQFNNSRAVQLGWEATAVKHLPSGDWVITETRPIPPDVLENLRKVHDLELAKTLSDLTAAFGKGTEYTPGADNMGIDPPGEGGSGSDDPKKPGDDAGGAKGGGKTGANPGANAGDAGAGGKGDTGKGKDATGKGGGKPQDGQVVDDLTAKDGKAGGPGVGTGLGQGVGDGRGKDPNAASGTGGKTGTGKKGKGPGAPKGAGGTGGGTAKDPGGTKLGGDPNGVPGGHGKAPDGDAKDGRTGGNGKDNGGSTDPKLTPSATGQLPPAGVTKQGTNPDGVLDGGTKDTGQPSVPGGGQGDSANGVAGGTGDSVNAGKTGGGPGGGPEGKDGGVPGGSADGLIGGGGTHTLPWYLKWMNYAGKAVQFVGAVLEIAAGLAMLIAPEPTITKVGGVILLAHGIDSLQALIRGERTYTAKAATGIAKHYGASKENAELIGDIADVAVPLLAGGLGALGKAGARAGWKIPGFKVTPGWKIPGTGGYAAWLMKGAQNDKAVAALSKEDRSLYELGQRTLSGKDFNAMGNAMGTAARDSSTIEGAIARGQWLKDQNAGRLFGKFSPSWWGIVRPHFVSEAGRRILKFGTLGSGPTPAARAWGSAVFPFLAAELEAIHKFLFAGASEGQRLH